MDKKPIDYHNMSNVRRIRWYRSRDRELPIEEWEMVADLPMFASNFKDNTPNETGITHYYCARYVFVDGVVSGPSDIRECPPITDESQITMKQNPHLN